MARTLIEQYQICRDRGHDSSHVITSGPQTYYRCKYCGTTYFDEVTRKERHYHPEVYEYLQNIKEEDPNR